MGFVSNAKIGGKKIETIKPVSPVPEAEDYKPDLEDGNPIEPADDLPLEMPDPFDEPIEPRSSNPFSNPFDEAFSDEKYGNREIIMPDEELKGFNSDEQSRIEEAQKEIENKIEEAKILTDGHGQEGKEKIKEDSEIKEDFSIKEAEELKEITIGNLTITVDDTVDKKAKDNDDLSCDTKEAREPYSLDAMSTVPKITFAKPKEEAGGLKKLLIFLCACIAVGVFIGVKANSYWVASGMKASGLESCYSWLLQEGLKTTMSPFSSQVFGTGVAFGAGLLGIIGLFIYLENDQKKRSRVGHEHGSTHIAGRKDFTVYKNKFMEE